ncbi:MAG: recombination protein RecR [Chloroflexota bacterium]|nr:recombination protein RecR [Chloroflexota bacterium]
MAILPEPLEKLMLAFERLPGIGPKTASRLAFYMLRAPAEVSADLSAALKDIKTATGLCQICFNITVAGHDICDICASRERNPSQICVVEEPMDVLAMERTAGFLGRYHVLHGALSPIEGIGPDNLRIAELEARVKAGDIQEIIVATNPSMEGDATALYLRQRLESYPVHLTRLARGLPVGGDLEYADQNTLLRALAGRQDL